MTISSPELAAMLSRALGDAKAWQLVSDSIRELGIDGKSIDSEQARQVLQHLSAQEGLIGISARFALTRLLLMNGTSTRR